MTLPYLLSVQDLLVHFQSSSVSFQAVKQISFSVKPGECLGVVGASGSGKSITALSILRLTDYLPNCEVAGKIHWGENQVDLMGLTGSTLRSIRGDEIALVFQEPMSALNPVYRCGKQVEEVFLLHGGKEGNAKTQILSLFKQVELKDPERIYRSYPHELSGGQKQRVLIAMALAGSPRLLIADEPTSALDVTVQRELIVLLKQLQQERELALLFISHDLGVVRAIADRVVVMEKGQIVEEGITHEILDHPQHPYTKALIAARPPMEVQLVRLPDAAAINAGRALQTISPAEEQERWKHLQEKPPLLQVEDLRVTFRKPLGWGRTQFIHAVEKLSFDLYPGERLGIVGESGSGKTTIGKALVGLVSAESGRVALEDQLLLASGKPKKVQRAQAIQMIFQDPYGSLDPRMSIGHSLDEALRIAGVPRKEWGEARSNWLSKVGLDARDAEKYPHQFSGGQRQRICIARALCLQPKVLICDESVSALDVSIQAQILNLLKDLSAQLGISLIFISHDMSVIRFLCDRVLVMEAGRLVEQGIVSQVFEAPSHPYTQKLLQAVFP